MGDSANFAYSWQCSAMVLTLHKFGRTAETVRLWVRQAEMDRGRRARVSTADRDRLKELVRENREVRRVNEILRTALACSTQAELDRRLR